RTQRLLQLEIGRIIRIGQLESGCDHDWIIDHRANRIAQQAAVDAPVNRVQLIQRLLPRYQLVSDDAMVRRTEHRVPCQCPLNAEMESGEVGGPAGPIEVEERTLLEEISR